MDPLVSLAAASLALVGTHFALSHPLRAPLVARIGEGGFLGLYSLVAAACMMWMVFAFRAAPAADLDGSYSGWITATIVTLPALVLFLGSLMRNPAFPGAGEAAARKPTGVFAVTRHPMMWGFALWAFAHIVIDWSIRSTIVGFAVLVLALVGAHFQDRKKAALMGAAWEEWAAKTSYWPKFERIFGAGAMLWLAAISVWLIVTWLHVPAGGAPAGIWRWVG